jgi:hypothetical protein
MSTQHTPGPWGWRENALYGSDTEDEQRRTFYHLGKTCRECAHSPIECGPPILWVADKEISQEVVDLADEAPPPQPSAADRALIAAAPDLLEALRIAVLQNSHDMLMTGDELRVCEAAIAKATGSAS